MHVQKFCFVNQMLAHLWYPANTANGIQFGDCGSVEDEYMGVIVRPITCPLYKISPTIQTYTWTGHGGNRLLCVK